MNKLTDQLYHAKILQKDVAKRAGVSEAMVSLVLNEKTKSKRVVEAAKALLSEKTRREK